MKSETNGASTSSVEVTNISAHGFWLWIACPFVLLWIAHRSIRETTAVTQPPNDLVAN